MDKYDYIVCGAGCAGLTFLYEILCYKNLKSKRILVIDTSFKNENDRTWCFWNNDKNQYNEIIKHSWEFLKFSTTTFQKTLSINPYKYNLINSLDFYNHIFLKIKSYDNIEINYEKITSIINIDNGVEVITENGKYTADFAFNSIIFNKKTLNTNNSLLQHFKGIVIETQKECFNPSEATFMDFSISQQNGTSFMYVLPTSKTKALVEYTLFTKNILETEEYDKALKDYIQYKLGIVDFTITHTEFGIIPMTDYVFPKYEGNIINLGTAAGCVKPSTGFAFNFIQNHTKQIAALLAKQKKPNLKRTFNDKKFHLYDSVLLEVLVQNKMSGSKVFESIFKKNRPQLVLKFLDNRTNIWEDLKIMASVPAKIFLPIALKKIFAIKNV